MTFLEPYAFIALICGILAQILAIIAAILFFKGSK